MARRVVKLPNLSSFLRDEKGSALIIVAAAMVVLMGFAALVTDVGALYAKRTKFMDTADAAALAGAQELPASKSAAQEVAWDYIRMNGGDPKDFEVEALEGKIRVSARGEVNYHFARVLGLENGNVGATAVAAAEGITAADNVAPLGINDQELFKGTLYTLKVGPSESSGGWFGALTLNNPGARSYEENLKKGSSNTISVGDIIETETGNMSGPTNRGVTYRLQSCNHCPQCTSTSYDRNCSRIILVPVYVPHESNGTQIKSVKVVGFAAFLLDSYVGSGNESYVKGYFVDYVIPGKSSAAQKNYGAYATRLIE